MLLAEVTEKQQFLREMARGISENRSGPMDVGVIFISLGVFLALVICAYSLYRYRRFLQGRWIILKKMISGAPVAEDRFKAKADVVLDIPFGGEHVWRTTTLNLSPGGMFVKMNPPLKPRSLFKFRLSLGAKESISGTAEVMWVQDGWTEHHPSGIGAKFTAISDTDRNKIRAWLRNTKSPRVL